MTERITDKMKTITEIIDLNSDFPCLWGSSCKQCIFFLFPHNHGISTPLHSLINTGVAPFHSK